MMDCSSICVFKNVMDLQTEINLAKLCEGLNRFKMEQGVQDDYPPVN